MFPGGSFISGRLSDTIVAIEEGLGGGPGGFDDAEETGFHLGGGAFPEADHIIDLLDTWCGHTPGAGDDAEAFHREIDGALVGAFVVPVADDDVFGYEVDGAIGIVVAG